MRLHDIRPNRPIVDLWREFYPQYTWRTTPEGELEYQTVAYDEWQHLRLDEGHRRGYQAWLNNGCPPAPDRDSSFYYKSMDTYLNGLNPE